MGGSSPGATPPPAKSSCSVSDMNALSVLIVEERPAEAERLVAELRRGGFHVTPRRVHSAAQVRAALAERSWNCILCSADGGALPALEVLALLQGAGLEVPLIALAEQADEAAAADIMLAGARDVVCAGHARLAAVVRRELEHTRERLERLRAEAALRASEERLNGLVRMSVEAIFVVDSQSRVVLLNPAAEKMFGCTARQLDGKSIEAVIPGKLYEALGEQMADFAAGRKEGMRISERAEISGVRRNGEKFAVEISVAQLVDGDKPLYSVVLNDISTRKRDEARLNLLVNFDPLTSLPNRSLFQQRLQRALVRAQRFNKALAVLFIDLDRFKNINDTLGHAAGDSVLQAVAAQLAACLREVDTVGRLGGDEFAVLVEEFADTRFVGTVARKLVKAVADQRMLKEHEYHITTSIGISTYPADGHDASTLLKNAEIAMYRAKEHGRNNSQFYAPAMNANSLNRLSLEAGLRHALERQEFLLHYQPRIEIASGRMTGMEALVRWNRPGVGMVSPGDFIPIAEETGLIVPIGEWVLKTACERNRAWQSDGPPLRVAVNLSARQFSQASLVSDVARILDTTGLQPEYLELEITESMVMDDPERAIQTLRQLKSMGISLAIDDFGTGYSSLGYLKRFPIDNIKIDRAFIKDIPNSSDDMIITRTIIAMAHSLRLRAIAEGVETQAQHEFLREQGCDELQGFYFSKPLAEQEFFPLMQACRLRSPLAA